MADKQKDSGEFVHNNKCCESSPQWVHHHSVQLEVEIVVEETEQFCALQFVNL